MRVSVLGCLVPFVLFVSASASAQEWEDAERAPPADTPGEGKAPDTGPPLAPPNSPPRHAAPPSAWPPGTAIRVETAPPPPAGRRRGYHVHDGFYLRLNVGGGYLSSEVKYNSPDVPDRKIEGGGVVLDVMLGGSPARGLAVGGGLWLQTSSDPKTRSNSPAAESYDSLDFIMVGPFIDGFPDPQGGIHVGGALGFALLDASFSRDSSSQLESTSARPSRLGDDNGQTTGAGGSVWIGYDGWISSEWSLGGMLRATAAGTSSTNSGLEQRAGVGAVSLLFSALYH